MAARALSVCSLGLLALIHPAMAQPAGPQASAATRAHHAATHARHRHLAHAARTPAPAPAMRAAAADAPAAGPAPVPNEAVNAPIDNPDPTTSVAPSVFQLHYPPQGDGYVTGSSTQAMDDRNAAKATGVEVKVPLPQ